MANRGEFMENYVGKRLDGRYEIQEITGVGGMSVVYKAYDSVDDRVVAIKVLKEEYMNDTEFVRKFKNESKAISVLSHPNIVRVYDVSFGDKIQYIVEEYVDGITLKEYIEKQKVITWNEALFFTTQILRALQHAHDKGIVHRDIKPQNIILLPDGNIKVTDFGIARFSRTDTRTMTESAMGSVHYISPEQAKGDLTDERADIYSLGAMLYEMLTGRVPFEADTAVAVALMQINDKPQRLTEINPNIPLGLEQICFHAMQKDPKDRYQTAAEMLLDVEEIMSNPQAVFDYPYFVDDEPTKYIDRNELSAEAEQPEEEKAEDDKGRRKKIITGTIIGVVVLIAVIVGLIIWFTRDINATTYTVENYVGQYYDDVISNGSENFELVAVYEESTEYDVGVIISQSPEAGERATAGTTITLTVSQSDNNISVPTCYNLTVEKAEELLKTYNLSNYRREYIASEAVSEGRVVYTDPKAKTVVSSSELITIYVSTGEPTTKVETYQVPSVEGLSESDARQVLSSAGFTNISTEQEESTVPKGTVLSQSPIEGSYIAENSQITLMVSTGYTTTTTAEDTQFTVHIYVYLPTCYNSKGNYVGDTLNVYVSSSLYKTTGVKLDGDCIEIAVPIDSNVRTSFIVELDDLGASESFRIRADADQDVDVNFVAYSDFEEE